MPVGCPLGVPYDFRGGSPKEICRASGLVINRPAIHNTRPVCRLGPDYRTAYRFMVRKWRHRLPSPTVILPLTGNPAPLALRRCRIR